MTSPGCEPLLTPEEAAERLNMSKKTLMEHVKAGRLRFINIGTLRRRRYRFTAKNLATFIENQKVREAPACPSIRAQKARSTAMISNSTVIAFTAQQKPETEPPRDCRRPLGLSYAAMGTSSSVA